MRFVTAGYEIIDDIDGFTVLQKLEKVARICYKSEELITDTSCYGIVRGLIKRGHEAILEHISVTVKFITDRGVTHELVRHRLSSYAQESTRYCNYSQGKFGSEIACILPGYWMDDNEICEESTRIYYNQAKEAEKAYNKLIALGNTPQQARIVLPTGLKTEIYHTANLREWRHILKLRAIGTTGNPHPQIQEIMIPLLLDLHERIPVVFEDIADMHNVLHTYAYYDSFSAGGRTAK